MLIIHNLGHTPYYQRFTK